MLVDSSILATLRCFEAGGRLLNFTRAAEELHITQSAVSQQIRLLEARLGFALFVRRPRSLQLTPKGQVLLKSVGTALHDIGVTIERLRTQRSELRVSCLPSLALHWLVPRLTNFYQHHSEIPVRLTADLHALNRQKMETESLDLAIRYEPPDCAPPEAEPLMKEFLFPVATPEYLARHLAFQSGETCKGITFLHDASPWAGAPEYCEWQFWLQAEHPEWLKHLAGPQFNLASLMISAALNHQGVALGRTAIALDEIKTGRLINVFSKYVPASANYILLYPRSLNPQVALFRDWLKSECKRFGRVRQLLFPKLLAGRKRRE